MKSEILITNTEKKMKNKLLETKKKFNITNNMSEDSIRDKIAEHLLKIENGWDEMTKEAEKMGHPHAEFTRNHFRGKFGQGEDILKSKEFHDGLAWSLSDMIAANLANDFLK